jgi:small GTP-binding protein
MPEEPFPYDVFLSHSAKDKLVVRPLAERLRKDGVKVWFDEWVLKPGDSIPSKIEDGLERSRVLVLCMSANAFGSDWAQLESGTFRFRDPLNKERRFLPLRLDDAPIKGSLAQFLYINWLPANREQEYAKLVDACRFLPTSPSSDVEEPQLNQIREIPLNCPEDDHVYGKDSTYVRYVYYIAFTRDRRLALAGTGLGRPLLFDLEKGNQLGKLGGFMKRHERAVTCAEFSFDGRLAVSGSYDSTVRLWDIETRATLKIFKGHADRLFGVKFCNDDQLVVSASDDGTLRLWDIKSGQCASILKGHTGGVLGVAVSSDSNLIMSASRDGTLRLWDIERAVCTQVFHGHKTLVSPVEFIGDGRLAVSGSHDNTIRVWNVGNGRCMRIIEGHTNFVSCLAVSPSGLYLISGSGDRTVRLWSLGTGKCLRIIHKHANTVSKVAFGRDDLTAFSMCGSERTLQVWDLSEVLTHVKTSDSDVALLPSDPPQVEYTNAKIMLVGESGAGKTGLSKRLALNDWQPSDSTVGAWATQWKLPVAGGKGVEREIWLWDFGGQADQRLIHQLYMDETALAVLVFDGQKEDLFETLGQWDRDLTRASRKDFAKLLVAGRVDAGGLRLSRSEVEKFVVERKFHGFLETSAKRDLGCEELKRAILDAIPWDDLPCRTTEVLFKRLKEEIIALKDEGRVLMRFKELRETLQLRLPGELARFADAELRAVLTLLAGPGVVLELAFGSWVLLQPERINAYAQAVIRTLQADEHQRGCLMEERVLKGDLMYESSMTRLESDEERFVLLAMHQTLVERGLCLRQPTTQGNLLVFPSYYRKERPDIVQYPAVQVNYRFTGFLDELYATLVVSLHHTAPFDQDKLWRYAADFKTNAGRQLGIKLTRRAPGVGDLEVYFDTAVAVEEKIIFSKYVHEHLLQHARDVERLRHYVCQECGTAVGNREVAMKRLNDWLRGRPPQAEATATIKLRKKKQEMPSIICVGCEKRLPLWDEMEQCFASPEIQQRVRDMQAEANVELDNESKERALVGEVISTVALAAQISREKNVSDHGIDMEIEFKDDAHEATHRFIFLQLKSGDSYTRKRKKDGTEIFTIKDERHARYWMASPFPVLLVIRNSEGEVRWMEIRDWLKRESDNGKKPVKQIVFAGERFDVMSVRRWRDKILCAQP